jgi:AraC family transcriptional regulator
VRKKRQAGTFCSSILSLLMPSGPEILQLLREIGTRLDGEVSLEALAARAGWSPYHFHRAFRRFVGETPKQYTQRLRLERAAAKLVTGAEPIVSIAASAGFASHAVFTRAFRRHFGRTPADYRAAAMAGVERPARRRHAALSATAGPCVRLFHVPVDHSRGAAMPTLSIERRELAQQPILFVRARAARDEISTAIGECLGKVYPYALTSGQAIAGRPFTRYLSTGPGLFTMEIGMPVSAAAQGTEDIEAGSLPGGPAVVAVHAGPYDQVGATYAAMERWIEANGLRIAGAPWESYITDPAEHPDPADWRTEIYWPVTK